ncbi:MAG: succinate dehydrogenase, hydrophobic membrane anchor protein [Silicimonas sp.]|nr:succinate dehydrogenase, hydrophobic membrane anchor protein [Silicimonas sp.]
MDYKTDRKRATGMGSSRAGTEHHWQMILSSIGVTFAIPLFILTFGTGLGGSHEEVLAYFSRPFPAILMAVVLVVCIRHFLFEALEAIEDYVHGTKAKLLMFATRAFAYLMIATGLFALAKLAL